MTVHETQLHTAGKPLAEADRALILLHGRGATAESILPLGVALDLPDFAILAPQAKDFAWYPQRFTAPKEQNEPFLSSALNTVAGLIKQVEAAGIPRDRIVLGGFSQGACLASEFAAQNPTRYGGLLVFSGGLIGAGPTVSTEAYQKAYSGSLDGTPVFIGCSDVDPHIPLVRVQQTTQILTSLGASVTEKVYPGMGHTVVEDELKAARRVLASLTEEANKQADF
ncbi:dienelactone hydrolase family protein [soil metagenome]